MKIYKLLHNTGLHKSIDLEGTELLEYLVDEYENSEKSEISVFNNLKWAKSDEPENVVCDFPFISGNIPVISENAYQVLKEEIEKCKVELLHLNVENQKYYLLHFLESIDSLIDVESSEISYFRDGSIMSIEKYCFHDTCSTPPLFLLSEYKIFLFGNQEIKRIVEVNDLQGLSFEEVF